ncbi:hypothetical protein BWH99_RS10980 [Vibrio parahaemolyticus]|nr:hypothetical protein [Vibrio parahaemolyticus]EIA9324835.1 hypothetical protein [Vibrio parahaemolyticus]EJG1681459.1 hypothetical protein [Vibrio parahaemolyticus]
MQLQYVNSTGKTVLTTLNCLLLSLVIAQLFGPSDLIIFNDALVYSDDKSYLVAYQQPFYGANHLTSKLLLLESDSFRAIEPTRNQAYTALNSYPYNPTSSFFSRHSFVISFLILIFFNILFSSKRKYYLSSSPDVVQLERILNELNSSFLDRCRFFWIKPILSQRIKANKRRKELLFQVLKDSFNEHSTHSEHQHNVFFELVDEALAAGRNTIRLRVTFDKADSVKVRMRSSQCKEYLYTTKNPVALYFRLKNQLRMTDPAHMINSVKDHHVSLPQEANNYKRRIEVALVSNMNAMVELFNLQGIVSFELAYDKNKPNCLIHIETSINEYAENGVDVINTSKEKLGGIFAFQPNDFDTPVAYMRPLYTFTVKTNKLNLRYVIPHRYNLEQMLKHGVNYKRELTTKLLPMDANLALSQFIIKCLRLRESTTLGLERFEFDVIQKRMSHMNIRRDVVMRMEDITGSATLANSSKAEINSRYKLCSAAYCASLLNDDAEMVRCEIYYTSLSSLNI